MKKKFIFLLSALVAGLGVGLSSCNRTMTGKDFSDYQIKLFSAYYTNNLQAAKDMLYKDLQTLSEWQSNHVEGTDFQIDYDACKALDHERLFLIYWKTHETNKMEFEFQQSMQSIARSSQNQNVSLPPCVSFTYDKFAKELEMRDRNANANLKTNFDLQLPK